MLTARSKRFHASRLNSRGFAGLLVGFVFFIGHLSANQGKGRLNAGFPGDLPHQRNYQTLTTREDNSGVGLACPSWSRLSD
jgi:hypothetical protein